MRTTLYLMFALAVSLAAQPAHAKLVLVFDDPSTENPDLVVEDNGPLDNHKWVGDMEFCQPAGGDNMLCVSVISKPEKGTATAPFLQVQGNLIRWEGELDILVTDTDFNNGPTTAELLIDGTNTLFGEITFNYWSDPANQPFGMGQLIYETTIDGDSTFSNTDFVDAGSVGSLTLEVNIREPQEQNLLTFRSYLILSNSSGTVPVPDVVGQVQNAAEQAITDAGLGVGTITTEASDTVAAGSVISQNPDAGTEVSSGATVNLVVSAGTAPVEVGNIAGLAGLWWDPAFDGEGFNMVVGPDSWLIYYYGWRSNGQRLWLLSETRVGPILYEKSITFDMFIAREGVFSDPVPELEVWGEMTLIFDSCTTGRAQLQGDDGIKTVNIVKLLGIGNLDCDF